MSQPKFTTDQLRSFSKATDAELAILAERFTAEALDAYEDHKLMLCALKQRLIEILHQGGDYDLGAMAQAITCVIDGEAKCLDLYANYR
ncbi:hypothetical protein U9S86_004553 [Salmonella enterica]|nr:hypothetical protein [Salmonella enterica]EHA9546168.1 hypothetical protein [Salmonella enterica subsp. enterica serovar Braenderup]EHP7123040.1 hypothetical protein [Salmonella enterica subsp. enterica serovar Thompson]EBH4941550.1 hypothetical protein [Salmonella enterica]ECK3278474.1 hypothetical protein [Salmonella enterica]